MTTFVFYALFVVLVLFYIYNFLYCDKTPKQINDALFRGFRAFFKTVRTFTSSQPHSRGNAAEIQLTHDLERLGIPKECIFRNLYIKTGPSYYTQVDVVALTSFGILVFEVKNYSGWIFGTGYQNHWTQVLSYGRSKFSFYNPILQNARHIEQLRKQLPDLNYYPVFNIVIFYGYCELKDISEIPLNTFVLTSKRLREVLQSLQYQQPVITYLNQIKITSFFNEAAQRGNDKEIRALHVQNIKSKYSNE